jgi:hypothetical protein
VLVLVLVLVLMLVLVLVLIIDWVDHWGPPNYQFVEDGLKAIKSAFEDLKDLKDDETIAKLGPKDHIEARWPEDVGTIWRTYK